MKPDKLRRTLDRALPAPDQADAILARLLREERKEKNMKKFPRKAAAILIAAALLATSALAVAAGLDQKLIQFFGAEPREVPLLSAAAVPLDVSDTSCGTTLRISQAIADRYSAMLLVEITAPAGTVLDAENLSLDTRLDATAAGGAYLHSWSYGWDLLEDGDPADNHVSLVLSLNSHNDGASLLGAQLDFTFRGLYEGLSHGAFGEEQLLEGTWRCQFTLPAEDPGRYVRLDTPIELDGCRVTLRSVYLSPITFCFVLSEGEDRLLGLDSLHSSDFWQSDVLRTTAGEEIPLKAYYALSTSFRTESQGEDLGSYCFQPARILDPAEIEAVTIWGREVALR